MTYLLTFLAFTAISPFSLWVYYLAVMNLKRARDAGELKGIALYAGAVVLAIGYALDAYVNVFFMSVLLLELPQETTVTARLKRHIRSGAGWRFHVARLFIPLLEFFDPSGKHITE